MIDADATVILSAPAVCPALTGLLLTGSYRCRFLCAALRGPAGPPVGAAEGHAGVARAPQSADPADSTRPADPGHHDGVAAHPVLDQSHQHRRWPLGHAPAEEPQPG